MHFNIKTHDEGISITCRNRDAAVVKRDLANLDFLLREFTLKWHPSVLHRFSCLKQAYDLSF